MHVFHLNCPSLSTLWVIVGVCVGVCVGVWVGVWVGGSLVFVRYLLSERSYSPETPEGDLHALEQPRANQVHFSAQERHEHAHIHGNKRTHGEKLTD